MKTLLKKYSVWWIAFAVFAINFILKISFLDSSSIAWDEPFTIFHAQMEVKEIVSELYKGNNPPFFEIVLHYWMYFSGLDPFWMRFLSLIFSCITAVLVFLLGNRFFNRTIGITAGALFTFANYHVFFAHEVRVYAWLGMWMVLTMYVFLKFVQDATWRTAILLMILNAILMYSHYLSFFLLLVQFISVISIAEIRKKVFGKSVVIALGVLVLFLPNILVLMNRFQSSASNGTWIKKPDGISDLYNMLWKFSNQPVTTVLCLAILLAAGIKFWLNRSKVTVSIPTKVTLIWFLFPLLFQFLISFKIPMFIDRYLIFASVGYYLSVAIAANYIFVKPVFRFATVALVISLFAFTVKPNLDNKRHVQEAVSYIQSIEGPETTILICGFDFALNFSYYYDRELFENAKKEKPLESLIQDLKRKDIHPLYQFEADLTLKRKVIYLDAAADFSNPGNGMLDGLNGRYELKRTTHFKDVFNVYEFELK